MTLSVVIAHSRFLVKGRLQKLGISVNFAEQFLKQMSN